MDIFPLYDIDGHKYRLKWRLGVAKPVRECLKTQGRFEHLNETEIVEIQAGLGTNWKRLLLLETL